MRPLFLMFSLRHRCRRRSVISVDESTTPALDELLISSPKIPLPRLCFAAYNLFRHQNSASAAANVSVVISAAIAAYHVVIFTAADSIVVVFISVASIDSVFIGSHAAVLATVRSCGLRFCTLHNAAAVIGVVSIAASSIHCFLFIENAAAAHIRLPGVELRECAN